MKRIFSLVVTLLVMGALSGGTLWAADPWKSNKKYAEWSQKEVRKVLEKSPWAKTVTITLFSGSGFGTGPGTAGDYGSPPGGGPTAGAASGGQPTTPGGGSNPGQGGFGDQGGFGGGGSRSLQVLVRWQTALPVRQAFARRQIQDERITPEQAEQLFQQTPDEYVVMVGGMSRAAMSGTTEEKVKARTYLKTGDKQRIMVQEMRMSQGQAPNTSKSEAQVPDMFFVFPRAIPIELRHKSVEFVTELGQVKINKKFKLKDMLFGGKLEL
jgi:hypothetical protein